METSSDHLQQPLQILKSKIPLLVILIALILFIVMAVAFVLIRTNATRQSSTAVAPTLQPAQVELQTDYKNPFDKKTQYKNPFSGYKNPFDSIR